MLKRLFGSSEPAGERHGLERRHLQVSVAVLMHEARRADYEHVEGESDVAELALRELFGVSAEEAAELLKEGRAKAEQLTSFYAPVTVIKRDFSMPERIRLIEHLWRISFADGQLNRTKITTCARSRTFCTCPTRIACSRETAPSSLSND